MDKVGRPRGLIRYSSQAAMEAAGAGLKVKKFRFRLVFYPAILAVLATGWTLVFANKGTADATILRNAGTPYTVVGAGDAARVANPLKLKLTNRTDVAAQYRFELLDFPEGRIDTAENPVTVAAGASQTVTFLIEAAPGAFSLGKREVWMRVSDGKSFTTKLLVRLLGPMTDVTSAPAGMGGPHE